MTTRDRTVLAVVAGVALLAVYWLLILSPKRDQVAKLDRAIGAEHQTLASAEAKLAPAEAARRGYARNYATVARLGQAVPAEENVPSLVYQLDTAASMSKVDFRNLQLTATPTAAAPAAPVSSPSASSSSSPSSPPSTSPGAGVAPTQAATATLPPGTEVGPAGFPTMPFSLTFDGSFFHMAGFFRRLERFVVTSGHAVRVGGRLLTLDGIAFSASRKGFPRVKATVAATAYLVPADQGASAGGAAASPAGTQPAVASGASSSSTSTPPAAIVAPGGR